MIFVLIIFCWNVPGYTSEKHVNSCNYDIEFGRKRGTRPRILIASISLLLLYVLFKVESFHQQTKCCSMQTKAERERERGVKEEKRIILIKWKSLANRQQSESVMYRRWGVYVAWFGVCECWLPSLNVIGGLMHILRIVWILRIVCKRENKWKQLPVENIAVIDKWLEMSFPHWELIRTKKP